jgi:hypothetical protein
VKTIVAIVTVAAILAYSTGSPATIASTFAALGAIAAAGVLCGCLVRYGMLGSLFLLSSLLAALGEAWIAAQERYAEVWPDYRADAFRRAGIADRAKEAA